MTRLSNLASVSLLSASLLCVPTHAAAPKPQADFFQHVGKSDLAKLFEMMDPSLRQEIDEPMLAAWVEAFNARLGAVQQIERKGWSKKLAANGLIEESQCDVTCANGKAQSKLAVLNGKLISFDITSEKLDGWFEGPATTTIYETRGDTFVRDALTGDLDKAYATCHQALQAVVSAEEFAEMVKSVKDKIGTLKQVELQGVRFDRTESNGDLLVEYRVVGEKDATTCELKMQFVGLKGHLLGFNFQL